MPLDARNYSPALMYGAVQTIKTVLTGDLLELLTTDSGAVGTILNLYQDSASPAANDVMGRVQFLGEDDGSGRSAYCRIDGAIVDPTAGAEIGLLAFYAANGSGAEVLSAVIWHDGSNGILEVGDAAAPGIFQSSGDFDVILRTGNSTTGSITITDGANGPITLAPNGSGSVVIDTDMGSAVNEALYVIATSTAIAGELIAIRGRAESDGGGASTAEARGVFGQGIATAALNAGTCTGVQGNAIAKDTSTVVTLRGGFFEAESENTPTSITNLYGTHTRVKTSVAPGTDFIVGLMETEKFGAGVALDSFLRFKTTTWIGGETVATDIISTAGVVGTVTNIIDYSTVTATSALYSDATITNFLETSADSKGGAGATRATPNQTATCDGSIVVKIGAKTLLIPLYNAVTIS